MKDSISLGPSPCDERCVQFGTDNYEELAREECQRFIDLIRQKLGPEPEGAKLYIKSNPYDGGSYLEVNVRFEVTNQAAVDYAFRCESESPMTWEG